MPNAKYTAQQKSDLGLLPTPDDISILLKDPNSWVAKLYQECAEQAALSEYLFIHYIISAFQAEKQATVEASAREKIYIRAEERKQQAERFNADLKPEKNVSNELRELKSGLDALLKERQIEKNPAQLVSYHQKLMNNFNQQVVSQLGPVVELKSGLTFKMPPAIAPVVSVKQVLAVNPVLAQQVSATPDMQEAFALINAKSMGYLTVLKMVQAIIDYSGKDESTISVADRKELIQYVDKQVMKADKANPELFKQLFLNGVLSIKGLNAPVTPTLAKQPALFSTHPAEPQPTRHNENKPKPK